MYYTGVKKRIDHLPVSKKKKKICVDMQGFKKYKRGLLHWRQLLDEEF